jgi:hypothetical protein
MLDPLNDALAAITIRDYACSNCWSHLIKIPAPNRLWYVKCPTCGDDTRGYVRKEFVARRRSESIGEKMEVKHLLRTLKLTH